MADEFIKKEIFNIHMQRIDQRFEDFKDVVNKSIERMEATSEKHLAKHDAIASEIGKEVVEIKGDVKAINARFASLESRFAWNLAWVGIIMALVLALVQRLWN